MLNFLNYLPVVYYFLIPIFSCLNALEKYGH